MDPTDKLQERIGALVQRLRAEQGMDQSDLVKAAGVDPKTLRGLEKGTRWPRDASLFKIEQALGLPGGTIQRWRAEPDALLDFEAAAEYRMSGMPALPELPRHAPNAPVLGQLDVALGLHPMYRGPGLQLSAEERRALVSARNRIVHNKGDFTDTELSALTSFIEDDELRTLHLRIDWLPRAQQLEVSALVSELHAKVEQSLADMGVTCSTEDEDMPAEAPMPNPLPYEGLPPDLATFPSSVQPMRRDRRPSAS